MTSLQDHDCLMNIKMETYDGWLTPPRSEHLMSRRPSLTSSYTDTQFSSSPQPTTPIKQSFLSNAWYSEPLDHPKAEFSPMPPCESKFNPHMNIQSNDFIVPSWSQTNHLSQSFIVQNEATLYSPYTGSHTPYGLNIDSVAMNSLHSQQPMHGLPSEAQFQQPQIVVPSQLVPYDDISSSFTSHDVSSFSTDITTYSNFDEDDWEVELSDDAMKPREDAVELMASSPQSSPLQTQPRQLERTSLQARKRSSRRRQKADCARFSFENFNTEIVVEGDSFRAADGFVRVQPSKNNKAQCCKIIKLNGQPCSARFHRPEHLKRHQLSHSDERAYPCPLPDCPRAIQRGDNAGDHFKTHMKGPRRGQRNKHAEWPVLKKLINAHYEGKTREKLIRNLERWILTKPEAEEQRHWLADPLSPPTTPSQDW